jgi:3-hydroxy-9,10-secoandrosta-1,3,5(10)-triene-9,17-dione monooxygenase
MTQNEPRVLEIDFPPTNDWLSPQELATLTPAVLRERMVALKPLIASKAASVEASRRPDPQVWRALRKSGVFYMFVPKVFGGLEMTLQDLIEVMLPVGEACASTCWCATFVIEHNVGFVRGFSREVQARMFKQYPYITAPGVIAPPGMLTPTTGGYLLNGHWRWGSAIMNADWIMVGALKPDPAGQQPPTMVSAIVPARDVTVYDTWYMDGMAGTGSNDFAIKNLFVPEEMVGLTPIDPANPAGVGVHDAPLYRVPFQTLLALTTMLPALGAARAALALALERSGKRLLVASTTPFSTKESHQIRLGRADTMIRASELLLRDAAAQMMAMGETGNIDFDTRSRVRSQIMQVMEMCRTATGLLADASGSSAHHAQYPMQRYLRDVNVIASHALYESELVFEQRGRALFGLPQTDALT